MEQTILNRLVSRPNLSSSIAALLSMLAVFNMRAFNYTDFSSTNGLSLVGIAARHGAVLQLTPAAQEQVGSAWAIKKQQCAAGFDTAFRLLISNPGSRPGTLPGADGLMFTIQNTAPTDSAWHPPLTPPSGCVSVFFNTFLNWPGCADYTQCDVSDNSVGVVSNGLYLAQADLTPLGINLKDGVAHTVRIIFNCEKLTVWLDGLKVLNNVPVPGLGQAVDASGSAWVGFAAATGWAWETHDILSWAFKGAYENHDDGQPRIRSPP